MKKLALIFLTVVLSLSLMAPVALAKSVRVKGYTTKRGTYVAPHYKTSPNKYKYDNWSTKGNYNPYTGKKGYINPFKTYKR